MYDDRLKIYSPEGMMDRRLIQQQNPLTVPSKRRNPLLADFFSRLGLMKRRGSEMKKIINAYKSYEHLAGYRAPEFTTNASEFHVTLWNLNFKDKVTGEITPSGSPLMQELVKGNGEVDVKEPSKFAKEFIKTSRQIYKLISQNPQIRAGQTAESIGLSTRQIQKYLKRLQELGKITRIRRRKMGEWKIIDEKYEVFFDRICYVVFYFDMDKQTKEQRHRCMSAIKGKNTNPELLVRKFLFGHGFRYRLNHPRLLGHPDLVLRKYNRRQNQDINKVPI